MWRTRDWENDVVELPRMAWGSWQMARKHSTPNNPQQRKPKRKWFEKSCTPHKWRICPTTSSNYWRSTTFIAHWEYVRGFKVQRTIAETKRSGEAHWPQKRWTTHVHGGLSECNTTVALRGSRTIQTAEKCTIKDYSNVVVRYMGSIRFIPAGLSHLHWEVGPRNTLAHSSRGSRAHHDACSQEILGTEVEAIGWTKNQVLRMPRLSQISSHRRDQTRGRPRVPIIVGIDYAGPMKIKNSLYKSIGKTCLIGRRPTGRRSHTQQQTTELHRRRSRISNPITPNSLMFTSSNIFPEMETHHVDNN